VLTDNQGTGRSAPHALEPRAVVACRRPQAKGLRILPGMTGTGDSRLWVFPLGVLLSALLVSCGGEDGGTSAADSSTPASPTASEEAGGEPAPPPGTPECGDVWQEDAKLPRRYGGCAAEGVYVKRESLSCESGQVMVHYGDRFYAVLGGTIHQTSGPLEEDRGYKLTVRGCTA
jgi:hypothetical protein